ncbi:FURIN [Lepeophtheirus salmonis]|uniref:furin n=1 Tax=Lepeophtheirus salmonis TaxID=72036 RepID=A0A7R8H422_LEPSM|nr:FURIN [Lepeophtheirus salmonis]CAF2850539.1 FURIN [Lepeophtheirus salmonis]
MKTSILHLFLLVLVKGYPRREEDEVDHSESMSYKQPKTMADSRKIYLNEWWTLHLPKGLESAITLASKRNLILLGEVIPNSHIYHFQSVRRGHKRSKRQASWLSRRKIMQDKSVTWGEQCTVVSRVKREGSKNQRRRHQHFSYEMNDPYWHKMWYLNREDDLNMNVEGAWEQGVTGKGVAVTILDDGIEKDHPDLLRNYDPLASTDINDNDSDPNPRYDFSNSNRHGTRCAGQVAASPNNSLCAVGIAYNAQIGGIRMLDGQVSDAVEARSLSFNPDHVDIYSSSWGPNDDGKTVDGPGKLAHRAFHNGVTRGRSGKGSIFVWASGNGGRFKDNCNCDGYATSIYTITVSSTSESGRIPWYSEACASTLATTYSSGTTSERQIVTTDLHHSCTLKHTGTSASAPMAAGIIALALEANPNLTWRDVQHLVVRTSRPANLRAPDWRMNAMGRLVSHSYGYGLMDTSALVKVAKKWNSVPEQMKCKVESPYYYKVIPAMGYITIHLEVKSSACQIKHLEHVLSPIHVATGRKRGDLRIYLQSPMGTRSTLLDARPQDYSSNEIHNDAYSKLTMHAKFFKWSLELYGTANDPNQSDEDKDVNVIREVPDTDFLDVIHSVKLSSSTTTTPTVPPVLYSSTRKASTTELSSTNSLSKSHELIVVTPSKNVILPSGCVSFNMKCTRNVSHCRTFAHRSVANIFCKCIDACLEVAVSLSEKDEDIFNMQCDSAGSKPPSSTKVPFFCNLLPFLNN